MLVYQQVKQLQSQGHSIKAITRHLGISRNTVRKYFLLQSFVPRTNSKRSDLLSYEAYLRLRWQQGEHIVKALFREIKAQGYKGSYSVLAALLVVYPKISGPMALPPAKKSKSFSSRSLSIALLQQKEEWQDKYKPFYEKLLKKSAPLRQ